MDEIVYLDGELQAAGEARVSALGQGILYGAGLFETMRAYGGSIFLLDRHIGRLVKSAPVIGIDKLDPAQLEEACRKTVVANKLQSARVRLTVSRGRLDASRPVERRPTVLVRAQAFTAPPPGKYRDGYREVISGAGRCSDSPLIRHKTTNYLECLLAREHAATAGYDEALFVNEAGNLAEGAASNLFLVDRSGRLVTPPVSAGLLAGITRGLVLEIASELGIETAEENVCAAGLKDFSEAFVTNSLIEIMPLASITAPGAGECRFDNRNVAGRLHEAYHKAVRQAAYG